MKTEINFNTEPLRSGQCPLCSGELCSFDYDEYHDGGDAVWDEMEDGLLCNLDDDERAFYQGGGEIVGVDVCRRCETCFT